MKKALLVLLSLLLFSVPSWGAIAFVACSGTCSNQNTSTTSLTIPATSTVTFTGGNFLMVGARASSTNAVTINTPTDTLGNTFHCFAAVNSTTPSGSQELLCYAWNITGGSDTITITTSATANLHINAAEYSGVLASCDPTFSQVSGATASGTSVTTSSSITIASGDGLMAGGATGSNITFTPGASFTTRATPTGVRQMLEDRLGAAAGSYSPSFSGGIATDRVIVAMGVHPTGASCPAAGTVRHKAVQD